MSEYQHIDAKARAICPETDQGPVYRGAVADVIRSVDGALEQAADVDRHLADLRDTHPTPAWRVATLARAGSLYDCIWTGLMEATPSMFTRHQQALLQRLQQTAMTLSNGNSAVVAEQIASTVAQVRKKWADTLRQYSKLLAERMVQRYVGAAVLARRFALEGFAFTRAAVRLPIVSATLGPATMRSIVESMEDSTEPQVEGTEHRHLHYDPSNHSVSQSEP